MYAALVDSTPLVVTVYANGEYAPWRTTAHAIRTDVAMWRRMHLVNWNSMPAELRAEGLDALLATHRSVLMKPQLWDRMNPRDWDRARMQELYRLGVVDVDLAMDDYFNPWRATRFAALWFGLLLDEAIGDLDLAVRAYNRGIANAQDERGSAYLEAVIRRLRRFIRNEGAPAAWSHVWQRARAIEREEWPWISQQ
ncbi:MAG TPA: hypothetical protein VFO14_17540 [Vicinamibacterales bacterium]|nr:hypothetical protein [Vicinamibacterales bacterium]